MRTPMQPPISSSGLVTLSRTPPLPPQAHRWPRPRCFGPRHRLACDVLHYQHCRPFVSVECMHIGMSLCCRISYMAVRCSICICCRVHTPGASTEVVNEDAERTFIDATGDKPLPGGRRVDTWSMCFQGGTFDRVKERCVASLSIAVRRAYVCVYHTLSSARHPIVCRLDAYRTYQTMSVAVACMSSTLSGAPVTSPSARSPNTPWDCLGYPVR